MLCVSIAGYKIFREYFLHYDFNANLFNSIPTSGKHLSLSSVFNFLINMENTTRYKISIVYDTSCKTAFLLLLLLLLLSVNYFSAVLNCLHGTLVCLFSCIYLVKVDISSFPHFSRKWRNQKPLKFLRN